MQILSTPIAFQDARVIRVIDRPDIYTNPVGMRLGNGFHTYRSKKAMDPREMVFLGDLQQVRPRPRIARGISGASACTCKSAGRSKEETTYSRSF